MNTATVFQGADHLNVVGSTINNAAGDIIHAFNYYNITQMATGNTAAASVIPIMPNSSANFTGRKYVLEKLKKHFIPQSTGDHDIGRRYFLIYGMGGIGKTQICLKFIEQMKNSFSQVFWIDASSEQTILLSLKGIAKMSGFHDSSESAILHWIGSLKENWLLVFDNADLAPDVVEKFIPPGQSGNILISSRNASLRRLTSIKNSYELQEMEEEDAVTLLLKAACLDEPSSSALKFAKAIVTELCCLPLAIDQAGSSIESGLCDINGYLRLYSSKSKSLLNDPHFRGASKYGQTVYGTWELSFQEIQRRANNESSEAKSAIVILKTFAFCHHSNIGEEIFRRAALNALAWDPEEEINIKLPQIRKFLDCTLLEIDESGQWDSLLFKQGIRLLLSFSLVRLGATTTEYSVHPLVHAWSRERLSHSEQCTQFKLTAALLSSSITWEFQLNDMVFRHTLLPHINKHYEATGKLNMFESYYDDEYDNFAFVFREAGYFMHSLKLQSTIFEMRSKVLGKGHLITLHAMQGLAIIYRNLGRYVEAEKLNIEVLELSKRLLGDEHPDTLGRMQNLANTYRPLGKLLDAEKLDIEVLNMSKRLLGDEHPDTLSRMQNLTNTYRSLGRLLEAEKLDIEVVEMSKRLLGDEHPDTLVRMQNLAITYRSQRRLLEAGKLNIEVLEMSKRLFGNEHRRTLTAMQNLAATYNDQKRFVEAEKIDVEVLEKSRRLLGDGHPDTLSGMQILAKTYDSLGRYVEAEKLNVEVLEINKRLFGDEHPDTLAGMQNLANTYISLHKFEEAEKLNVEVLEMSKRLLGDEHPHTLSRMHNLATTYYSQNRFEEAEKLYEKVLEMSRRLLGDEHPYTLARIRHLENTYRSLGKFVEAEKLIMEDLELSKKLLGDEHPETLSRMQILADTYVSLHRYDEAEKLYVEVLELSKKMHGDEHPETISKIQNLAIIYYLLDRYEEAEKINVEVLEMSKRVLGDEHPDTLGRMHILAMSYRAQGKVVEIEKLREIVLGIDNPLSDEMRQIFLEWYEIDRDTIDPVGELEGSVKRELREEEKKEEKKEKKFGYKIKKLFIRK